MPHSWLGFGQRWSLKEWWFSELKIIASVLESKKIIVTLGAHEGKRQRSELKVQEEVELMHYYCLVKGEPWEGTWAIENYSEPEPTLSKKKMGSSVLQSLGTRFCWLKCLKVNWSQILHLRSSRQADSLGFSFRRPLVEQDWTLQNFASMLKQPILSHKICSCLNFFCYNHSADFM